MWISNVSLIVFNEFHGHIHADFAASSQAVHILAEIIVAMRCDLHVHSVASGMCSTPVLNRICRESYNDAAEVYERLKTLGMSIVTVTDHDSIDAAEALRKYPDFFLSEEVTVRMPSGTEIHLGVYDIRERDHVEIQRRRNDFISLVMYLSERKLFLQREPRFLRAYRTPRRARFRLVRVVRSGT